MRPNRLAFHLSDVELVRIEKLAAAHETTVSAFVREVLARYRSPHEPPAAPLLPTLEPDDAAARRTVVPVFAPPEAAPPARPDVVIGLVFTEREAVFVRAEAKKRGLAPSTALRLAAEAGDGTFDGARRNFGERRDRPISVRFSARTAAEIRKLAKDRGRTVGDVVLERFAAWVR